MNFIRFNIRCFLIDSITIFQYLRNDKKGRNKEELEDKSKDNNRKKSNFNSWNPIYVIVNIGFIILGVIFIITCLVYYRRIGNFLMGFFILYQGVLNITLIIYDYLTRFKKKKFKISYSIQINIAILMLELALLFLISPPFPEFKSFLVGVGLIIIFFNFSFIIIYRERERKKIDNSN